MGSAEIVLCWNWILHGMELSRIMPPFFLLLSIAWCWVLMLLLLSTLLIYCTVSACTGLDMHCALLYLVDLYSPTLLRHAK